MLNLISLSGRMAWVAVFLAGILTRDLSAETVDLHDDFSNATLNEATLSIDSVVSWHGFHNRAGGLPTIEEGGANASGKALNFSGKSQNAFVVASFPLVNLKKAGDFIDLRVSYRYLYGPTDPVSGFVMGLFNSNGMPINAGNLDARYPEAAEVGLEQFGYRVGKAPNSKTQDIVLEKAVGLSSPFPLEALQTSDSDTLVQAKAIHVLLLKITRENDGTFNLEYGIDSALFKLPAKADSMVTTDFDTVLLYPLGRGFGESKGNNYIQVVDVTVTSHEK